MRKFCVFLFLLLMINIFSLNVVTSIKPLELIVKEISPNASITNIFDSFNDLKTSNTALNDYKNIDLVIMINNELKLEKNLNSVILSEGVLYYPFLDNPYLWTDPLYSVVIAYKIEKKLEIIDPENSLYYRDNLLNFTQKLINLSEEFSKSIKDKNIKIIDMNNLLTHFYERYNINYKLYSDDILVTNKEILVSERQYNNITFSGLKNKKINVDILASNYNNILDFYKSIIDNLIQ
ncbi:ABC-type Zn uptake system ZnuABC, Zn-binding component ZnuA [Marinitoga hydrogenitolerans DSM 16785]|uniref:ABC-type Zn uptake system ZnuABC, Zn-binding component ZnuA n=1 Tax=Marinitoga hydrogenitolerans (strain DSM 16785 / JCM 12826 / AT1271) TaxID=1122195 RepID=A0A1M4W5X0_MARH1|nr:zinc ABC transporter substrate-binding protein [Marinitoga hydrogenitolerans]SHE76535.1 ABC-type Zn uptake system ZnuABC, Zn-binding component ZnuA [Marinitoga hydrogenitolerans DSM 16785]